MSEDIADQAMDFLTEMDRRHHVSLFRAHLLSDLAAAGDQARMELVVDELTEQEHKVVTLTLAALLADRKELLRLVRMNSLGPLQRLRLKLSTAIARRMR